MDFFFRKFNFFLKIECQLPMDLQIDYLMQNGVFNKKQTEAPIKSSETKKSILKRENCVNQLDYMGLNDLKLLKNKYKW